MRITDTLREEHEVIQQVLDCLEELASRALARTGLDAASAADALEFLTAFADRCHHAKEELHLFPALNARGLPRDAGPIAVMLREHELGRAAIAEMKAALEGTKQRVPGAAARFAQAARGYVELLREHIAKEDSVLFPMAERMLGADGERELARAFERVEHHDLGPGTHERYLQLARSLCARLGVEWRPHATVGHACCGHASACR
jgi:hemerythrin-like domain-containing protein